MGDLVYIKVYRRKWDEPRREGPYEVTSATPTSIKVQGSNFWYHISHCLKINTNKSKVITHEAKNLFESPEEEALGHCISKDCALGAGIALEFRNRYGVEELVELQKGVGKCAYVEKKGRRCHDLGLLLLSLSLTLCCTLTHTHTHTCILTLTPLSLPHLFVISISVRVALQYHLFSLI